MTKPKIYIHWEGEKGSAKFFQYPIVLVGEGDIGEIRKERRNGLWDAGMINKAGVLVVGYRRPYATWRQALTQCLKTAGYAPDDYELVDAPNHWVNPTQKRL